LDAWLRQPAARDALLAIVPRHPQRFDEVAALLDARLVAFARRSALDDASRELRDCGVLLGDSMGELFAWYAFADVAIIGGSLRPFGSQNLIEACASGCPVVIGPSRFNFADAARAAIGEGAAVGVDDAAAAVSAALAIAVDSPRRQAMSQAGLAFAQRHRGATERTVAALAPLLDRALGQSPAAA
ncbi:MAG TPA: 3-deoxy-D-manno-octulosonic acid transferase, partial [Burkholderiaceae bacterium]|nr:3-deoxy-D-manno-octulosonic acid transferase [Burkholderiaceae bacterium]